MLKLPPPPNVRRRVSVGAFVFWSDCYFRVRQSCCVTPFSEKHMKKKSLVTVKPRSWCNVWVPVEDPVYFLLLLLSITLILEQWRNCLLGISQSETTMRKLSPAPPFSPSFLVNKCSNIAYKSSSDDYIYVQESLQEHISFKMQSLKIHWAHDVLS